MITQKFSVIFVLFAIISGITTTSVYADHSITEISIPEGSGSPGCQESNECYLPYTVTTDKGGEVEWTNDDIAVHTITAGKIGDEMVGVSASNGFDSGIIAGGQTFKYKFEEAGQYDYFCTVHPWMTGMVIVSDAHGEDSNDMEMEDGMDMKSDMEMEDGMDMKSDMEMNSDMEMEDGMDMKSDMEMEDGMDMKSDMEMENIDYSTMEITSIDDLMAEVKTTGGEPGEPLMIEVMINDMEGKIVSHVGFDVIATQNGEPILEEFAHEHDGMGMYETSPLTMSPQEAPIDIEIVLKKIGHQDEEYTGPAGVIAQYQVVPEFGTIAIMVLAVAIVSIVAITSKFNMTSRF